MLEKYVVARIMKALKQQRGVVVRKRHGTAMGVAGDADLYGNIDGRHFEIEVKRPDDPGSIRPNSRRKGCESGALRAPW